LQQQNGTLYGYVKSQFIGMINMEHVNAINHIKSTILLEHHERNRFRKDRITAEQRRGLEREERARLDKMASRFNAIKNNYDKLTDRGRSECYALVCSIFTARYVSHFFLI